MKEAKERGSDKQQAQAEREAAGPVAASPVLAARGLALDGVGNRALLALLRSGRLQRKARLSEPGEAAERAADRAADAVVEGRQPGAVRMGLVALQAKPSGEGASMPGAEAAARGAEIASELSGGNRLDEHTRALMESRFGEPFDEVRVHTGHRAAEMADTVQSRAFTVGADIVFGEGQFAPETTEGTRLLAHELAHVVQQRRPAGAVAGAKDAERDAHDAARDVVSGGSPTVRESVQQGALQREEAEWAPVDTGTMYNSGNLWTIAADGFFLGDIQGADNLISVTARERKPDRKYLQVNILIEGQAKWTSMENGRWDTVEPVIRSNSLPMPLPPKPKKESPVPPKPAPPPKKTPATPPAVVPPAQQKSPEVIDEPQQEEAQAVQAPPKPDALAVLRVHLKADSPDLGKAAAALSDDEMTRLLPSERESLLDKLAYSNDSALANQDTLIRLLTTTPQDDAQTILDKLRANDARLTQQLVGGFDVAHARTLQKALQLIYTTSLYYGAADVGQQGPSLSWPPAVAHYQGFELTPDGRVQFKFQQDALQNPPLPLNFDPFAKPADNLVWLGRKPDWLTPQNGLAAPPWANAFGSGPAGFPVFGKQDYLTRFINGPAPSKPVEPLSPEARARFAVIAGNIDSWLPGNWTERSTNEAFNHLSAKDFQQIQDTLGQQKMEKLFGQLSPFGATLIGSYGPVAYGREELNDKRAEFLIDTKDWGAKKGAFCYWAFDTMSNDDARAVLQRIAKEKRLGDTVLAVPGLVERLQQRGVDVMAMSQEKLTAPEGGGRALGGMWSGAWSSTVFGAGPGFEYTYLPEPYQKQYLANSLEDWNKQMSTGNMVRGVASYTTLGFSDIPVGVYEAGKAGVAGVGDLAQGKTGEGTEKLVPAVVMVLAALAGRKLAKGAPGAAAAADEALAGESKGFTLPNYKGPKSLAAARVEATLRVNPGVAAAGADLVDAVGADAVEKAAGYIQENSAAARFVAKNGVPGVQALVAADGDVAAAQAALEGGATPAVPKALPPGPAVKGLLPPWKGPPVRLPPPGMATGELAEEAALHPMRPRATLLPEKAGAFDATEGGTKVVNEVINTTDKQGKPIVIHDVTIKAPNDAIQIKTLTGFSKKSALERVVANVEDALEKLYNQPRTRSRSRTPIPGTNIYERTNVEAPKKITIIVQVPGEVTDAMREAAKAAVDKSTKAQALIAPIEVIVQQEQ